MEGVVMDFRWLMGLPPRQDDILDGIAMGLTAKGWTVNREPVVGNLRPDMVASKNNVTWVIEVKTASAPRHVNPSDLAQVAVYRDAYRPLQLAGGVVRALFVTNQDAAGTRQATKMLDVGVITGGTANRLVNGVLGVLTEVQSQPHKAKPGSGPRGSSQDPGNDALR